MLTVCEEGSELQVEAVLEYRIEYKFIDVFPGDGFASWVIHQSANSLLTEVADYCRELTGSFRQQALNRVIAQALIRENPACLVVSGLWGCTQDLPRVADLLNIPVMFVLGQEQIDRLNDTSMMASASLVESLKRCGGIFVPEGTDTEGAIFAQLPQEIILPEAFLSEKLRSIATTSDTPRRFGYSVYEFLQRDPPLLAAMQAADVRHFSGCRDILDVACGAGIFLDCLRSNNLNAIGVERDPIIAEYANGMGFNVAQQDALDFLAANPSRFDGVYCSHFVEHLPIEALQTFFDCLRETMKNDGIVVLVFPDPESIRSQLLGFWRDPEHVRFYHPELILALAASAGFELEWSSYEEQPHDVIPFSVQPAELPDIGTIDLPTVDVGATTWVDRLLSFLGVQSSSKQRRTEAAWLEWAKEVKHGFEQQQAYVEQVANRTDSLWAVNRTWAWNDNVTLRLRRR